MILWFPPELGERPVGLGVGDPFREKQFDSIIHHSYGVLPDNSGRHYYSCILKKRDSAIIPGNAPDRFELDSQEEVAIF